MGAPFRLLIPGPVPIDPRVMEELSKPTAPHYGEEWVRRYGEVVSMLRQMFVAPDAEIYPFAGPGHSAMDAIAFTLLRRGDRVVVVDNGFFGSRIAEVLKWHHLDVHVVSANWGEAPDLAEVERAVPGAKCLAVIHNETSTGMTNPLKELAKIATDHGAWAFVDAVSSLGALPLSCKAWGVDVCFSASQKALSAPAGIAPIAVSKHLMEETDPATATGWYSNLFAWNKIREAWGEWHPQPTTVSSNVFYAFQVAMQVALKEGMENRIRRHEVIGHAYREGLKGLGYSLFCDEALASNTVSSVRPPKGIEPKALIERLRDEHNISVAGTLGPMRGQGIRIGHMGTQADRDNLEAMLSALEGYSRKAGVKGTKDAVDRAVQMAAKVR